MKLLYRPRRLRMHPTIRSLVQETQFSVNQLILPLFVTDGKNIRTPNKNLEISFTLSPDQLKKYLKEISGLGIKHVLLFGVSSKRDSQGSEAFNSNGAVIQAIQEIRSHFPNLMVATDIALDPYTDHGHDGIFTNGEVLNDETVEALCKMTLLHAKAGAHMVAPSDMMDGRVAAIRKSLDQSGFKNTLILSYTAKYASCLYGPFRDALKLKKLVGDKKTYQMDPPNRREALKELKLDVCEGADIVMVKPASWYLDIISDFKRICDVPVAAYQVSGECAMIELGAKAGIFDRDRALLESCTSIFRAGADCLVTYYASLLARLLKNA